MPQRRIKVVSMDPNLEAKPEEPAPSAEPEVSEPALLKEPESPQGADLGEDDNEGELDTEELENLVMSQIKAKKQSKKDLDQCTYCNKSMSSKALKYSHHKICKENPKNSQQPVKAPEPEPVAVPDPEPAKPKRKRAPPKPKAENKTEEAQPKETASAKQREGSITATNIKDFIEKQKNDRMQKHYQRISNLRAQAF